jgi:hypothetical protein
LLGTTHLSSTPPETNSQWNRAKAKKGTRMIINSIGSDHAAILSRGL